MVGVATVSTCCGPHVSSISILVACEIWEEVRRPDETVLVERMSAKTKLHVANGILGHCM